MTEFDSVMIKCGITTDNSEAIATLLNNESDGHITIRVAWLIVVIVGVKGPV